MAISKGRDFHIDFIKGMGIILMVIGHSGSPDFLEHWIYLFHMAIFFIAAGYCWKEGSIKTWKDLFKYLWKKVKGLYIPYVLCNVIFALCNNLFVVLHIYQETAYMGLAEIAKYCLKVLCLAGGTTEFGGATWFLAVLFIVSVAHGIFEFILENIKCKKQIKLMIEVLLFLVCCIMAELISRYSISLPLRISSCFCAYVAFCLGKLYRKLEEKLTLKLVFQVIVVILSFILLLVATFFGSVGMGGGYITNILFFLVVSNAGWLFLYYLSELIDRFIKGISRVVQYIGQNTLSIVILHFLSLRIVSLLYIVFSGSSIELLSDFPVIESSNNWLWIFYTIVGVSVPLGINEVYKFIKRKLISARSK